MYHPLVSIVIPVYNGSNFLAEAIDSALNQTYNNIEILVVNDGSTDNGATEQIALSYGDKIRYFSKENGGVSSALNLAIENMKGEWFSWLSHDDLYTPDKIFIQVKRLAEEKNLNPNSFENAIVLCKTKFVDKNTKRVFRWQKQLRKSKYTGTQMLLTVFSGYYISGCSLLIHKNIFLTAGLFDSGLKYMQDMELWYRMMLSGCNFYYVNKVGVLSRVHEKQTTVTGKHLGVQDAEIVGKWMTENLAGKYEKKKNLLAEYHYLALLRHATPTIGYTKNKLQERNEYSIYIKIKAFLIGLYGSIRPAFVTLFYRLLHIKIIKKG